MHLAMLPAYYRWSWWPRRRPKSIPADVEAAPRGPAASWSPTGCKRPGPPWPPPVRPSPLGSPSNSCLMRRQTLGVASWVMLGECPALGRTAGLAASRFHDYCPARCRCGSSSPETQGVLIRCIWMVLNDNLDVLDTSNLDGNFLGSVQKACTAVINQ